MKCPGCRAENPEAGRFCQMCGRPVAPAYQYQQVQPPAVGTSTVFQSFYQDTSMKQFSFVLASFMIAAGASVVAVSLVVVEGSGSRYYGENVFFIDALWNGLIVVIVGLGMMIYRLSRGPSLSRPVTEKSLFHEMEPSASFGAVYGTEVSVMMQEAPVGLGIRALLYILSILFPAVGSVIGGVLYVYARPNYKRVGRTCMILSAAILVFITAVAVLLSLVILPSSGQTAIL